MSRNISLGYSQIHCLLGHFLSSRLYALLRKLFTHSVTLKLKTQYLLIGFYVKDKHKVEHKCEVAKEKITSFSEYNCTSFDQEVNLDKEGL